ncbi:MAG: hypothetical protein JXO22_14405 [Phycisphaerae bacterium]|nr:hypothetical protein [Phycisphaerae bacterium]
MHRLLSALMMCALSVVAVGEQVPLRVIASDLDCPSVSVTVPSPFGTGSSGLGAAPTPDLVNGDANGNPVLDATGGLLSQTLNLWVEADLAHVWLGVGFDIYATGDLYADITLSEFVPEWSVRPQNGVFKVYPGNELAYRRWAAESDFAGDSNGDPVQVLSVPGTSGDHGNGIGYDGDIGVGATSVYQNLQYELGQRGTWFKIGTITVTGSDGQIFLGHEPTSFVGGQKGDSIIYYGWGAAGIVNLDENLGLASDVPLLTVVAPEPEAMLLLLMLLPVVRRR